jgi:hypothetical protein
MGCLYILGFVNMAEARFRLVSLKKSSWQDFFNILPDSSSIILVPCPTLSDRYYYYRNLPFNSITALLDEGNCRGTVEIVTPYAITDRRDMP